MPVGFKPGAFVSPSSPDDDFKDADDGFLLSQMTPHSIDSRHARVTGRKTPKRSPRKPFSRTGFKLLNFTRLKSVYQNPRLYWPTLIGVVCLFFFTIAFQDESIFELLQRNFSSTKFTPSEVSAGPEVPPLPARCTGVCCSQTITAPVSRNAALKPTSMESTIWDNNLFEGSKVPPTSHIHC